MSMTLKLKAHAIRGWWISWFVFLAVVNLSAQSTDPGLPSPVRTNEAIGTIAARDLGDARLTDHYYAFTGTPGDLLITVAANNLNGDVDVFTAGSLRPLLKFPLYAESPTPVTKSIYLRRREDLILRVEARTPNDDEGNYRVRFGGSFEPIVGRLDLAETESQPIDQSASITPTGDKKTRRVSSVGARIAEPPPPVTEVAASPAPEPTPAESLTPAETSETPVTPKSSRSTSATNTRSRRPAGRRRTSPESAKTETVTREEPTQEEPAAEVGDTESKPKPAGRRTGKKSVRSTTSTLPADAEPDVGPRLIIETSEGTLIDRSMSSVRRVTVENGQVFVVGKDGKILRIQLTNIVRMSIAP